MIDLFVMLIKILIEVLKRNIKKSQSNAMINYCMYTTYDKRQISTLNFVDKNRKQTKYCLQPTLLCVDERSTYYTRGS
jgi:hypothetical protein